MAMVNGFKGDGSDNDRIIAWETNPANCYNCAECPEVMEYPVDGTFPCGQYNCWVVLTCATYGTNKKSAENA